MKKQYFGDENDYRKYGLLRCIAEATGLDIGILWLLTADDGRPDGEFRGYLHDARVRRHDEPLHRALGRLLDEGVLRDVGHAERWGLVPRATYFDGLFTDAAEARRATFAAAMRTLAHGSIVFLDPDNGVEVPSVGFGQTNSSRYVYWHEMSALFERGQSLLVYQHYPRLERRSFEASLAEKFRVRLAAAEVAVFSTPRVAFVLALQEAHAKHLPAIRRLVAARWAGQIGERTVLERA
ncbi:MAG: hypothetical protein WCK73_15985 [Deltaproteobacteria bacterium]